ncbi:molecular chaperone GrpE, partial [Nostoc linckia z14]
VPYNSQLHQPDNADITEGELVYIRFIGYQHQGRILCPAKVSRSLPGGGK